LFRRRSPASAPRVTRVGSGVRVPIPDPGSLVAAVLERSAGKDSSLHGEGHWRRVAAASGPPSRDPRRRPGGRVPVRPVSRFHAVQRRPRSSARPEGGGAGQGPARRGVRPRGGGDGPAGVRLRGAHQRRRGLRSDRGGVLGRGPSEPLACRYPAGPAVALDGAARNGGRIKWARDLQREHVAWEELYRGFGLR